jgi:hypothetical protein
MKEIKIKVPDGTNEEAFKKYALVFVERAIRQEEEAKVSVEAVVKTKIAEVKTANGILEVSETI